MTYDLNLSSARQGKVDIEFVSLTSAFCGLRARLQRSALQVEPSTIQSGRRQWNPQPFCDEEIDVVGGEPIHEEVGSPETEPEGLSLLPLPRPSLPSLPGSRSALKGKQLYQELKSELESIVNIHLIKPEELGQHLHPTE